MPPPDTRTIQDRLGALKRRLEEQGGLVDSLVDDVVDAVFQRDLEKAKDVIRRDEVIDRVDVSIEKDAVRLLHALSGGAELDENEIRMILTIVKVNNEIERIADLCVAIAERVPSLMDLSSSLPPKFRVMANSIIGIVWNTNQAFRTMDVDAARLVLASDDATEVFKGAILRDVEEGLARGDQTVDFTFALHTIAAALARIGDHCTNVAEQIIYVGSGKIVRHQNQKWTDPLEPEDSPG
jgi:phosphate transport system protein